MIVKFVPTTTMMTMTIALLLVSPWPTAVVVNVGGQALPDIPSFNSSTFGRRSSVGVDEEGGEVGRASAPSSSPHHWLVFYHHATERSRHLSNQLLAAVRRFPPGSPTLAQVDCFEEVELCSEKAEVHGFPSLHYVRGGGDGEARGGSPPPVSPGEGREYIGPRDADSIVRIVEKLSRDPVLPVRRMPGYGRNDDDSYNDVDDDASLDDLLSYSPNGVAFVMCDPNAAGTTVEEVSRSTPTLRAFEEFALERLVHEAAFGVVVPGPPGGEGGRPKNGLCGGQVEGNETQSGRRGRSAVLVRIERDVEPRSTDVDVSWVRETFFRGRPSASTLANFYEKNRLPIVSVLGRHNFDQIAFRGRRLAILVTLGDPLSKSSSSSWKAVEVLRDYAAEAASWGPGRNNANTYNDDGGPQLL